MAVQCRRAVAVLLAYSLHTACVGSPQDWPVLAEMQRLAWEVYELKTPALPPVLPPAGALSSCVEPRKGFATASLPAVHEQPPVLLPALSLLHHGCHSPSQAPR